MASLLQIPVQEMGDRSLTVEEEPEPVSTTCYVFANTEAYGLLRAGLKENEVLAAYLYAIAYRLYTLTGRMKVEKDLALAGGLAKNTGVAKRLERELGLPAVTTKYDPQITGAVGAALFAETLFGKSK